MSEFPPRFRPALQGLEDRTVPATVGTPTQNFVEQVYRDILHRPADPGSLTAWSSAIDNRSLTRQQLVLTIEGSDEGLRTLVNDTYQRFLRRPADPAGQQAWVNFLKDGNTTTELQAELISSQEYFQLAGGTNQGFVNRAYQDLFGRAADPGSQAWVNQLNSGRSRRDLALDLARSDEGRNAEVSLAYTSYLRRTADAGGLSYWSDQLRGDTLEHQIDIDNGTADEDIEDNTDAVFIAQLLGSPEYFQNNGSFTTNAKFPSFSSTGGTGGTGTAGTTGGTGTTP